MICIRSLLTAAFLSLVACDYSSQPPKLVDESAIQQYVGTSPMLTGVLQQCGSDLAPLKFSEEASYAGVLIGWLASSGTKILQPAITDSILEVELDEETVREVIEGHAYLSDSISWWLGSEKHSEYSIDCLLIWDANTKKSFISVGIHPAY